MLARLNCQFGHWRLDAPGLHHDDNLVHGVRETMQRMRSLLFVCPSRFPNACGSFAHDLNTLVHQYIRTSAIDKLRYKVWGSWLDLRNLLASMASSSSRGLEGGMRQRARAEWRRNRSRTPPRDPTMAPRKGAGMRAMARQEGAGTPSVDDSRNAPMRPDDIKGNDFRAHVSRLFLMNTFSGKNTHILFEKAERAGAMGSGDLAQAASRGRQAGNANRDLLRKIGKGARLPSLYWAQVPLQVDEKPAEDTWLPFILPHEVLGQTKNPAQYAKIGPEVKHLDKLRSEVCGPLGLNPETVIPLGVHGDGVPHQKAGTIECLSWNTCANPDAERTLFTAVEKRFLCKCGCAGRHTINAILEIKCWSRCCLANAAYPSSRHDGGEWLKSDKERAQYNGPLPRALLMQVRAGWAWYKQIFNFPCWSNFAICWRCMADKDKFNWQDVSANARWRKTRLTDREFFRRQRAQGIDPCPLFSLPGFVLEMVAIDVLHALDLGFSQNVIANVLWEFLELFAGGANRAARLETLFALLKKTLPRDGYAKPRASSDSGHDQARRQKNQDADKGGGDSKPRAIRARARHGHARDARQCAHADCDVLCVCHHGLLHAPRAS